MTDGRRRLILLLAAMLGLAVGMLVRPHRPEPASNGESAATPDGGAAPAALLPPAATPAPEEAALRLQLGLDLSAEAPQLLTVLPAEGVALDALERRVVALGGAVRRRIGDRDGFPRLRIALAGTSVAALAAEPEVGWVERFVPRRFFNDVAASNTLMNVTQVRTAHGLTGRGQVVTTSDSGIDTGDLATLHADIRPNLLGFALAKNGRFKTEYGYATRIRSTDVIGHGTHTAGSIVGTGALSGGQFKGIAPEAKLWAWFCAGEDNALYTPDSYDSLFRPSALATTNAFIHSASWGGDTNVYNSESYAIDTWCWRHPDFLPVFAAGNEKTDASICAEGAAKNVLCVGATENYRPNKGSNANNPDELAYFSSRGPMPDGRIKPDVCAPGTYVVSTRSSVSSKTPWGVYDTHYFYNTGTSMATPLTAGAVALVRQWLVEQGGFTNRPPSAALMKAIITGGAHRLGATAPNKDFGWGRVDLEGTLFPTNGLGVVLMDYIPFSDDSAETYDLTVTNTAPLDIHLCWIDYPAMPEEALQKSLVIDLDLTVSNVATGETYTPNDHVNNLESVHLDNASPGVYRITVRAPSGLSPIYASTQGGAAALYVRGAVTTNECVTVTVAAEGGGDRTCSPTVGKHLYVKGTPVTFTAGKYADDGGHDYRHSEAWGLDVERYPLAGWRLTGAQTASGTNDTVTLKPDGDVTLTWRWPTTPSHVALWLSTYDAFAEALMYPGGSEGTGYWKPYGEEVTVEPSDAPILASYHGTDGGRTVSVDDAICIRNGEEVGAYRYGTLRLTSFFVRNESGTGAFVWNAADRFRAADSVTLPMTAFTAVEFGYADERVVYNEAGLPFWWWARNFRGAVENGALTNAEAAADGDPDGDGFTNRAECDEPTDPWREDDFPFRFTSLTPTNLTFIGSVKGTLSLRQAPHPTGPWTEIWQNATLRPGVTNAVDRAFGKPPSAFFRLTHEL